MTDDGKLKVDIYPVTIIPTRYSGTYESDWGKNSLTGGPNNAKWACFPCDPTEVPEHATGSDDECSMWWDYMRQYVGLGYSPNNAYVNLDTLPEEFSKKQADYMDEIKEEFWEGVSEKE